MGTATVSTVIEPCNRAQLLATFNEKIEDATHEYGTDPYSGTIATKRGRGIQTIDAQVFADENAAYEFMSTMNLEKDGPSVAARFVKFAKTDDKTRDKLVAKLQELRVEKDNLPKEMIQRAKAVKSKTRGCAACGSSIAVAYIGKATDHFRRAITCCPICDDPEFLRTKADTEKMNRLTTAMADAEKALADHEAQLAKARVSKADPNACPWLVVSACRS